MASLIPARRVAQLSGALLVASAGTAHAGDWQIDPAHTSVQFSVRHMMVSTVRGSFGNVTGTVHLDEQDATRSKVELTIDARTIDTREAKRDAHLRSADFFDVEKHPTLTFRSTRVQPTGKGKLKVTGDLTMRGITRPVGLSVEGPTAERKTPWGQAIRGATATAKLNRKDFGLGWNKALETGGLLVGEEVQIQIDVELIAQPPASAIK